MVGVRYVFERKSPSLHCSLRSNLAIIGRLWLSEQLGLQEVEQDTKNRVEGGQVLKSVKLVFKICDGYS
jgi:hypothetical protein